MYPTVNALMGLWQFVSAKGMSWRDGTAEVRAFLHRVTLADLQDPATWPRLTALVQIVPERDVVPVRARYEREQARTIGLNHLIADHGLWFTLADCVASKLLTGRIPVVRQALIFEPGKPQDVLSPVQISG